LKGPVCCGPAGPRAEAKGAQRRGEKLGWFLQRPSCGKGRGGPSVTSYGKRPKPMQEVSVRHHRKIGRAKFRVSVRLLLITGGRPGLRQRDKIVAAYDSRSFRRVVRRAVCVGPSNCPGDSGTKTLMGKRRDFRGQERGAFHGPAAKPTPRIAAFETGPTGGVGHADAGTKNRRTQKNAGAGPAGEACCAVGWKTARCCGGLGSKTETPG